MIALHRPAILVALLTQLAGAQAADTTHHAAGATVSGVVLDSITRTPLAGATVELVAADSPARFARTAISDSLGRFTLTDVPDGRHKLGFFHPMLDSLGVDAPLREIYVAGQRNMRADLAIPSSSRLRRAICGRGAVSDSGAVIIGTVRDARDGSPAADATVTAEWIELSFRRNGVVSRHAPRRVAKTGDNGWFALCNVPNAGIIALGASRGSDSTDLIEVQAPAKGFLRHELYIGPARTFAADTTRRNNPATPSLRRARVGDGRLTGTVVGAADGRPMADAQVSITDGPQTRANDRGEWTLVDAPTGTRMLEIRELGYYPERRRVDIIANAAPVHVALFTLEAILDTVRVTASRLNGDPGGFERRRKSRVGHYLTRADIERWSPVTLSDIFRVVPGVQLEYAADAFNRRITVRGAFGKCDPAIYLNGQPLTHLTGYSAVTLTAGDLDTWVSPHDVTGIEIYAGDTAPVEYQQGMSGCGSILIWTRLAR